MQKFWRILNNSWTCEFEVNLVEKDGDDEPELLLNLLWLVAATIGVIWLIKTGGRFFLDMLREPTTAPRRRVPPLTMTSRTKDCMTMSTRMKGEGLRFAPTKASD